MHKGSCVCGAVSFEVTGELEAPTACHCTLCRKQSGHFWPATSVKHAAFKLTGGDRLTWYQASDHARRGFCATCGAYLFWEPINGSTIGIALGAFDSTGLHLEQHIYTADKGDYYDLPRLTPPARLERTCKGLAMLDAILSPDWESRYYSFEPPARLERTCKGLAMLDAIPSRSWESRSNSFDSKWAADARMASMRNGSGDDYFIVFTGDVAFLKGFEHEQPRADPATVFHGLPLALAAHRTEPAFSMEHVTYGGYFADGAWTIRGDDHGRLAIPNGQVDLYAKFAADYYERQLPLRAIYAVMTGKPLDAALLGQLAPDRKLEDLAEDLEEIGY